MIERIKNFLFKNTSDKQTVAKNTFWLFLGEIMSRALKMFLIIYAARILGVESWGTFSYVIALLTFFITFSDVGLSNFITRETAKDTDEKFQYLSTAFYLKIGLLFFSFIALFIFTPFIIKIDEAYTLILPVGLYLLFDSLSQFGLAINRALEKMENEALIKILGGFSTSLIGVFFLISFPSSEHLALSYMIGAATSLIVLIIILKPFLKPLLFNFKKNLIKPIFIAIWPLLIMGLLGMLFTVDTIILGWWESSEQIGYYSVAQRLVQFINIIPTFFAISILPTLTRFANKDAIKFRAVFEQAITILLLIAIPIVSCSYIIGEDLIKILFGDTYIIATKTFTILCITIPLSFINSVTINAIFAFNRQKDIVVMVGLSAFANLALSFILIPSYGIVGAAYAIALSSIFTTTALLLKMKKINYFTVFPHIKKIIFATVLTTALTLLLKILSLYIIATIILSISFYIFLLWYTKEQTIRKIYSMLQNKAL